MFEFVRGKFSDHTLAAQANREIRRPTPVQWIVVVVLAPAVVKEREPRQYPGVHVQRLGQGAAMYPYAAPMRHAVDAIGPIKPELRPHHSQRLADDRYAAMVHRR